MPHAQPVISRFLPLAGMNVVTSTVTSRQVIYHQALAMGFSRAGSWPPPRSRQHPCWMPQRLSVSGAPT